MNTIGLRPIRTRLLAIVTLLLITLGTLPASQPAAAGDMVTFSYVVSSRQLATPVSPQIDEDLAAIVQPPVRNPIQDDVFYFVPPDRFDNGDPANDEGDLSGDRLVTGFDPTDKGFYHGGDLAGLLGRMDYLEQMGITAIWMTPLFKNRPVQGSGDDISAGYHGYWITDFTQLDPHFGTNVELEGVIDEAHRRGIQVFFDIITNHTADVIGYAEDQTGYRDKVEYPYRDASGNVFDDRDHAGGGEFPPLDPAISFPYTPIFSADEDATAKVPDWLNNPIYYHHRGDSTFSGESSLYGDFFGLDDLFTEHPDVVQGMIDIYRYWVSNYGIDGFRIDTMKHVNPEFWRTFIPAIQAEADAAGKPDFFLFGEVFSSNVQLLSFYTTDSDLPAVLDFRFQEGVRDFVSRKGTPDGLRALFEGDDYFTDADSNVYSLPTFIGNHDRGRFGFFLLEDNGGALSAAEMLDRSRLAHALMYFARGVPVVYYGDEQGFTGDGGDKDARQDMFPSQVASYNDDDLIGTGRTTADDNFDPGHPLYQALQTYADLYQAHQALRTGAQIHRFSGEGSGIYAFSRMDRDEQIEYVIAANNADEEKSAAIPTYYAPDAGFELVYAEGEPIAENLTTGADGSLPVTVPAWGFVIYRAAGPIPTNGAGGSSAGSAEHQLGITIANLSDGQEVSLGVQNLDGNPVPDRLEIRASLDANTFAEVTFAVRETGTPTYTVIGVDDNPPYRVFYDASHLPEGTAIDAVAVANDLHGNLAATTVSGIRPLYAPPAPIQSYPYAVIHYLRGDEEYGDHTSGNSSDFWGLHLWGDAIQSTEATDWTAPKPFLGEDSFGRFAYVALADPGQEVHFIVHRGDAKDGSDVDRSFHPAQDGPEIWLVQDDPDFYTSQADAQGYVTVHYHRDDGDYEGWGLHLWGDGLAEGVGTSWEEPRPSDDEDDFGIAFRVPIADDGQPVNFIVHRGDEKDPGPDQSLVPAETAAVWIRSGDEAIYRQPGAAQGYAILHYQREDGDYGDPTSDDFRDFWGLHVWTGATEPNPSWQEPLRPDGRDRFGIYFRIDLAADARELAYILHRGDEKDPGLDQFLRLDQYGYEVWQLENANVEDPYVLPIVRGAGSGDLGQYRAHWLAEETIAWDVDYQAGLTYTLHYAPAGDIRMENGILAGGRTFPIAHDPAGLDDELRARFPHLAGFSAFRIGADHLDLVPVALTGQLAISARDSAGQVVNASGLQIPGVLDDLYTYDGPLGVIYDGDVPTLRVWAPTARSVRLHLFDTPVSEPAGQGAAETVIDMVPGDQGTWSVVGEPTWTGRYYLYEVEVYVHATGQVEHNLVTDPYSVGLAMNSTHSLIVDLDDPVLKPDGWDGHAKPELAAPEDIVLYELHVRDFSAGDRSVPEVDWGTFRAFTHLDSAGMRHLAALAEAGLTHVHLLPVFDIATIDEDKALWQAPDMSDAPPASPRQQAAVAAVADRDGYNWGYDPYHYTVPEGSYASGRRQALLGRLDDAARTLEFREMVQTLHSLGLRVVMDVVYNHTHASGQVEKSVLDRVVPGYYHRLDLGGQVTQSTCCANTATEHAMMEKLMVDSLLIWARAYGVDGFRFDLMGHHMVSNMEKVQAALAAVDPTLYLYGEGWDFGEVAGGQRGANATQGNLARSGIGTFNDRLRDAVRGGGPFDSGEALIANQGFINGLYYDPNASNSGSDAEKAALLLAADQIRIGLAGNLAGFPLVDRHGDTVTGAQVDYNGSPAGYTQDPQENVVYVSAHDNQTLFDINQYRLPLETSMDDRVRAQNLGMDLTVLAQGVPFLHAGVDMLRSKSLDRDSYNSGDWFNRLDFTYQTNNWGVGLPPKSTNHGNWYLMVPLLSNPDLKPGQRHIEQAAAHLRELLQIRRSSPLFRLRSADEVLSRLRFHNTGPDQISGLIAMSLSDRGGEGVDLDPRHELLVVLFNASNQEQTFQEPAWQGLPLQLHPIQAGSSDPTVKSSTFDPASATFTVPARTTAVFVEYGQATITIAVQADPSTRRAFHFEGDLGRFALDGWELPDEGEQGNARTFQVSPGSYTVTEQLYSHFWRLAELTCDVPGRDAVDLEAGRVVITVDAGEQVTCTFGHRRRFPGGGTQ